MVGLHSSTQRAHKSDRIEQAPFNRTQSSTPDTAAPNDQLQSPFKRIQTSTLRAHTVDLVVSGGWAGWFGLWDFALFSCCSTAAAVCCV